MPSITGIFPYCESPSLKEKKMILAHGGKKEAIQMTKNKNIQNDVTERETSAENPKPVRPKTAAKPKPAQKQKPLVGVVTDCFRLNIRKKPDLSSEVIAEAAALAELAIDPMKSDDTWLSVSIDNGVKGYCMKKYVAIKK